MDIEIYQPEINQTVEIPASKSYLQRYIALASICNEWSVIKNPNYCDDVIAALNCARAMGAEVICKPNEIKIKGISKQRYSSNITLNVGESGLLARMYGIMAPCLFPSIVLKGKGSLLKRNMQSLINILLKCGCHLSSQNNYLPLEITGYAQIHHLEIEEVDTSQVITGLLYAAVLMENSVSISLHSPVSVPYLDVSIDVAKQFNLKINQSHDYHCFYVENPSSLNSVEVTAEGDWSNAAYFAVAAALAGKVKLLNLRKNSFQGDKIIIDILSKAGAKIIWSDNACSIEHAHLNAIQADLTNYPDLFPPLCVLCLGINKTSQLKGVKRLLNKESNRAQVLLSEFSKLGGNIEIDGDIMIIHGKGYLNGGILNAHNDHRIAMAGAIASVIARDKIRIQNAEAVRKSYPDFYVHFVKSE